MHDPSPQESDELRARAEHYREMAETARLVGSQDALLRLACRFEALAAQVEAASAP